MILYFGNTPTAEHAGLDALWALTGASYVVSPSVAGGLGSADSELAAIMAAAPAGSTIVFPSGFTFNFTAAIAVPKSLTFRMDGATVTQSTAGQPLFSAVGVSGIRWLGGKIRGAQYATETLAENAFDVRGTSAASPATDIIIDVESIDTFGMHGVYLQYVERFFIECPKVTNLWYAGVGTASAKHGVVSRSRATHIIGAPNSYGFYFSRLSTDSLTTDPRSEDILCVDCVADDVANWEGFDTHGGKSIRFVDCSAFGCFVGGTIGGALGASPGVAFAPLDCHWRGGVIDSRKTDGSAAYGLAFVGAAGSLGSSIEKATGSIADVIIRGHGSENVGTSGAIYCHDTLGLQVTKITGIECSPAVIMATDDNTGFDFDDITAIDVWTKGGGTAAVVSLTGDYQSGRVDGLTAVRGSKVIGAGAGEATLVNDRGLNVTNQPNIAVAMGDANNLGACTAPLSDGGSRVTNTVRAATAFKRLATFEAGLTSSADLDATGGFRHTVDGWYFNAIGGSQALTGMHRQVEILGSPGIWIAPSAGSITCVLATSDIAVTGGLVEVQVWKNGVDLVFVAQVVPGQNGGLWGRNNTSKDFFAFAAGDQLQLKVRTVAATWGGTANVRGAIVVEVGN